jgi:hypothetical protein
MKQKRLRTDANSKTYLDFVILVIASLFYLYGCTEKALQLARDKASPLNIEHRKIKSIISAVRLENEDIAVCVELNDSGEKAEPKMNTIILPPSILTGDNSTFERLKLHTEDCQFGNIACYWYPIKKAKIGCETLSSEKLLSASVIPVERLAIDNKDRKQLYDLLHQIDKNQPFTEKIYEVRILFDKENIGKKPGPDEAIDDRETEFKDILLVYRPGRMGRQGLKPIGVLGTYEDNSTDLYYLLVPLAFTGDLVVVAVAITAYAILSCPNCFMYNNH